MKRAARNPALALVLVLAAASVTIGIEACSDSGSDGPLGGGGDGGGSDPDGRSNDRDGASGEGGGGDGGGGSDGAAQDANFPESGASCVGVPATCGGGSKDCCASTVVTGGTFNRSNDNAFPATVSTFKLDVYEVTVARFRAFVNAGKGTQASPPAAGVGAHPKIASSGWDPSFNASLPADSATLRTDLKCDPAYPAWSDAPGGNETRPINCVTWFDAFAFCAWDGGWLPTETEWNYAAAGGGDQRDYPWNAAIDQTRASYDCLGDLAAGCTFADMLPVGSKPLGDGKYGQADLAGNVWEWTLDWSRTPYRLTTCVDCADLQAAANRTFRGGGFPNDQFLQRTSVRLEDTPLDRDYDVGFRCARPAP